MTLPERAVIAAARRAAPLQSDIAEAGRNWRLLLECFDLLDGVKTEAQLEDETRAFLREVALGTWDHRPRYEKGGFLSTFSVNALKANEAARAPGQRRLF